MQAVFTSNANKLNQDFLETIKKVFKDKVVKITLEAEVTPGQKELWKRIEALQKNISQK